MRYFAYASNMSPALMTAASPGRRFLAAARLPHHRLAFTRRSIRSGSGVADVVPEIGAEVWGALYELRDDRIEALDLKEGVGFAYERSAVVVHTAKGEELTAFAYTVISREAVEVAPSLEYLRGIVEGAEARSLPESYLASLRALAAHWHGKPPPVSPGPRGDA